MAYYTHICGLYYIERPVDSPYSPTTKQYLPQVSLSAHTTIVSSTSRTTLTQNFVNPFSEKAIPELRYTFPLYDGVSVVGFTCVVNKTRVIQGVVKERAEARKTYDKAVERGETAGLLEQLPDASDVFTTTVGNVPAGAEIQVEIVYLGELKHDAEVDGIRFTIPTSIAPRYGAYPGELLKSTNVTAKTGISIVVDAEMPAGCNIKTVQSPSHPVSVTVGNTSAGTTAGAEMSLQKASATLSLGTAELDKDFVLQIVATGTGNPIAVLETHPTIPNHRAIMATLVPKFNLPSIRPEIVFVCDRSGSMGSGRRIPDMKSALQIFLKSLPVGVKFNICSFGSHFELLFPDGSRSYDAGSLAKAEQYVSRMEADFGGTEMYAPLDDILKRRHKDMELEVFLLTDGEVWNQGQLFGMIDKHVAEGKGAVRLFTLGIGTDVSHSLIEGIARAGNGFAQTVGENEQMNTKVIRMLKAALTPHVKDYTLEVKYGPEPDKDGDDDFEIVEKVMDTLTIDVKSSEPEKTAAPSAESQKKPISLFDKEANPDVDMIDPAADTTAGGKYAGVPPVPEPKLLQAPFEIPPLYPFNRTSVYLLMSPESAQRTPTSIVLRGTSLHGPLELEISVVKAAEAGVGETIHQLAARKAIRELEDGSRGWLHHARDGPSASAQLLKDKYPGRFSDMIEREAVRLGVKYQVGGKWCSFVAVEENGDESNEANVKQQLKLEPQPTGASANAPYGATPMLFSAGPIGSAPGFAGGGGLLSAYSAAPASAFAPAPASLARSSALFGGAPPPPQMGDVRCSMPSATLSFKAASAPRPHAQPVMRRRAKLELSEGTMDDSFDAALSTPPKTKDKKKRGDLAKERSGNIFSKALFAAKAEEEEEEEEECDADDDDKDALHGDALDVIVRLQTFAGSWAWDPALFAALGLPADQLARDATKTVEKLGGPDNAAPTERLATALVLVFLEERLAARHDEWEMLAEKGRDWLRDAGVEVDSFLAAVKDVMEGTAEA